MPDLVAEVAEQRPVRLVHRHSQLLAVHVVALGEVQRDHAVLVTGEHLLELARQQVECESVIRVFVAPDDRQLHLVQFDDQPSLRLLRDGERHHGLGVGLVRPSPRQGARRAQPSGRRLLDQPVALGEIQIRAQLILARVDGSGVFALFAGCDDQERHVLQ